MKFIPMLLVSALLSGGVWAADEKPQASEGSKSGGLETKTQDTAGRQKQWEDILKKLAGTEWRLERIGGKDGAKGVTSTLDFKDNGMVSGVAAVNRFNGAFKVEQGRFKTGPFMTTRRAGPPEAMEQERLFLAALSSVRSLAMDDGKLILQSGCGCGCEGDCRDGCQSCGSDCRCDGKCPPSGILEFMLADRGHPLE